MKEQKRLMYNNIFISTHEIRGNLLGIIYSSFFNLHNNAYRCSDKETEVQRTEDYLLYAWLYG